MNATYGQIAYDAYCKSSGGKSLISGATLPAFEGLSPEIKTAWEAAAAAVLEAALGGSLGAKKTEPDTFDPSSTG